MATVSRALVLGGGGITGIAWELGLLAGLAEAGLDIMSPDLVVGTSAGSVVGAQILSGDSIEDLYARQLADPAGEGGARMGAGALARFVIASAWPGDPGRGRAYLGRAALAATTHPESDSRAAFEALVPRDSWPERRLLVTAVDAETGEPRVFDRDSGVALRDAVAASCAVPIVWPPITIQGHRYIDGGVRSIANADLAAGCDRVVVLAPVTVALRPSGRIAHQLSSLGREVRSVIVSPDAESRTAIGRNVLDPAQRAASARAGLRQAAAVAAVVEAVWSVREGSPGLSGT
ncbi:MAG TPA: patatin-like phospholipase family protein [Candidatus Dormibacteraeota bacterium]|nr:patatin-like phospholipase family protein [Candidatus Dormibacteraeota bacterium]